MSFFSVKWGTWSIFLGVFMVIVSKDHHHVRAMSLTSLNYQNAWSDVLPMGMDSQ